MKGSYHGYNRVIIISVVVVLLVALSITGYWLREKSKYKPDFTVNIGEKFTLRKNEIAQIYGTKDLIKVDFSEGASSWQLGWHTIPWVKIGNFDFKNPSMAFIGPYYINIVDGDNQTYAKVVIENSEITCEQATEEKKDLCWLYVTKQEEFNYNYCFRITDTKIKNDCEEYIERRKKY